MLPNTFGCKKNLQLVNNKDMYNTIWFDNLIKPFLNPPAWVFPPVWILLYITIFVSLLFFTLHRTRLNKTKGYIYFIVQILLNILWPLAFFLLQNIGLAMCIVILMDIFVYMNIKEFYKVSKFAGLILIPYFVWILFATYLNISFFILN